MRCEEIMKRNPECLMESDTIRTAATKMRDENIGFLPVCDRNKKVLGTLTDRDIAIRVVAGGKPLDSKVTDVMTKQVVCAKPSDDVNRVAQLMAQQKKSRIMVCDERGILLGVISLSDLAERDADQAAQTMRQVSEREAQPHP